MFQARTERGGYSKKQVELARGKAGCKKKPMSKIEGMEEIEEIWELIFSYGKKTKRACIEQSKEKKKDRKAKRDAFIGSENFYTCKQWRELRAKALEKYECQCMMCGRSPKNDRVVLHVDHIKPKSKFPELALDINNLQILCACCNVGKSNKFQTDWRPDR